MLVRLEYSENVRRKVALSASLMFIDSTTCDNYALFAISVKCWNNKMMFSLKNPVNLCKLFE